MSSDGMELIKEKLIDQLRDESKKLIRVEVDSSVSDRIGSKPVKEINVRYTLETENLK